MASDVMRVRLHLRETRVLAVASDTPSELRVEVESSVRRPRCPACGFRCVRVHDTRGRKVRDLSAIDAHLGHARHVLDRFHIIRWFSAGLTQVRRDIQRRPEGSKPAFDPEVFGARFALLRRGDTLTDTDRARLDALLGAHPRLRAGWQALQELHGPLPRRGPPGRPGRPWDGSATPYETGELPEFHDIVDTIIAWSDEILA